MFDLLGIFGSDLGGSLRLFPFFPQLLVQGIPNKKLDFGNFGGSKECLTSWPNSSVFSRAPEELLGI